MKSQATAADALGSFQQALSQGWQQAMASFQSIGSPQGGFPVAASGMAPIQSMPAMPRVAFSPEKVQELQRQYVTEATELWRQGLAAKPAGDRRFSAEAWADNPVSGFAAAVYLLNARTLMGLADAVEADAKTRARLRFAIEQWLAATSPSNSLALNADAQKMALQTQGQSIAKGMQNLLHDLRQGHLSMTDESAFEVGRNVATSEGAVVFENEIFQLLEYKPLTAKVHERPFLLVPPCINKFYILDLQPANSLIRYAVEQGHRVFVVSWRNPDESMREHTWDDYIEDAAIKAIHVVQDIASQGRDDKINALGFCVGGTILSCALAVLAARGEKPVASLTLLTTLLDFTDTGVLDIFIDEQMVKYREMQMGKGGLLAGQELGSTFSFLRPNDLVWNYVVGNYLKGEKPPAFDLLYWNGDATNLPGPFYAWYLRNTYLENKLAHPGALTVCGEPVDLGSIDVPTYIFGSREDHIVPIGGAYASTQILQGKKRFVMGASGHIAGVINPPAQNKRSHWVRDDAQLPATHAQWLDGAQEQRGSWWTDWSAWLETHAGKLVPAPKAYGRGRTYQASEPAPGSYVKARA